MLERYICIERA